MNSSSKLKLPTTIAIEEEGERLISKSPESFKTLKQYQITDKMIAILEQSDYIISREDLLNYPSLRKSKILLQRGLINEPSLIAFFSQEDITNQVISLAIEKGYIPTETDFEINPYLGNISKIMTIAIKHNPRLILYIQENCYLSTEDIDEALNSISISIKDLENHPVLCKNRFVMSRLPEFELYSFYASSTTKKNAIINYLKSNDILSIQTLPFFDPKFGSTVDPIELQTFLMLIISSLNHNDINEQKRYFEILDKIIDGIINNRYMQKKRTFSYPDIASIKYEALTIFYHAKEKKDSRSLLTNLVNKLHEFTGMTLDIGYIEENILKCYQEYKESGRITIDTIFGNTVLNHQRNYFISLEKRKILSELSQRLQLTETKKNTIINSKKLEEISCLIFLKDYSSLGINETQLDEMIEMLKIVFRKNKYMNKNGLIITDEMFEYLKERFKISGKISPDDVKTILLPFGIQDDIEVFKYISKKFEQIRLKLLDTIELTEFETNLLLEIEKVKLAVNPSNFNILDMDRYYDNIASLLLALNENTLLDILSNKEYLHEINYIIPLVGLLPELDINFLVNLLSNYSFVRKKIIDTNKYFLRTLTTDIILSRFGDLITFANGYSKYNAIYYFILGEDIISQIGEDKSRAYVEFYVKMFERISGNIPPITIHTDELIFESGRYYDLNRLLIGRKFNSCIDLTSWSSGGEKTFVSCLQEKPDDVILVKDANGNLKQRILIFRRGNVIQLVTQAGEFEYGKDICTEIARQILQQSKVQGDNIDYIFINDCSLTQNKESFLPVYDDRFVSDFPHADTNSKAYLIADTFQTQPLESNAKLNSQVQLPLDFDSKPQCEYPEIRPEINYDPSDKEITRLRALRIILEKEEAKKRQMSSCFKRFYMSEYIQAVCGKDWYIALKKDGTLEELFIPNSDPRSISEFNTTKKYLLEGKSKPKTKSKTKQQPNKGMIL